MSQIGWRTTAHQPTEDTLDSTRHQGISAALPKFAISRSRRRLRRRWPGSHAGLCLGEARPAQSGPHPQGHAYQDSSHVMLASTGARPSSSLAIVQLAASASMAALRAVAVRSAMPTLDPVSTHKDLGTCGEEALDGIARSSGWR